MKILQVEGFIDWLYEVEIKFLVQERFGIDEGELITIILKGVTIFIIEKVKKKFIKGEENLRFMIGRK